MEIQDINKYKKLSHKYFNGTIRGYDEFDLFDWVSNPSNKDMFMQWEMEWIDTLGQDTKLVSEWRLVSDRISRKKITPYYKIFRAVRNVAAVVAILFAGYGLNSILRLDDKSVITVEAPYGEKSKVTLFDGSVVWLNSGSKLSYNPSESRKTLVVELNGEGFFDIMEDAGRKFIVKTSGYDIEVKGTQFNVSAYADDRIIATTLLEGLVHLNKENEIIILNPGESAQYDKITGLISKSTVDTDHAKEWIEDIIVYDNITLNDLAKKLSRRFNMSIVIESSELGDKQLNIALRNGETLNDIFQALELILDVDIYAHKDEFHIKGRN